MQNVTINIVDSKDCEGKLGQNIDLSDNLRFCAGLEEGGHDTCQVGMNYFFLDFYCFFSRGVSVF